MAERASADSSVGEFPRVVPVGDSAILVEFGSVIDPDVNTQVYTFASQVQQAGNPAVIELVPTYRSLLIQYDALSSRYADMLEFVNGLVANIVDSPVTEFESTVIELPVVYGGEDGPDLDTVAGHAGLSPQEVIDIHSGVGYRTYMIGFAPGFPYLGGLDERIACPRLKTPRISVPAGSVGIAESQTGVYPNASPGGWQLIGRTAAKLFDVNAKSPKSPALITPGSEVRFVPVKSHD